MATLLRLFCLLSLTLLSLPSALAQPIPEDCHQLLLVISPDWDSTQATLQLYEREGTKWCPQGSPLPVMLGRKGLAWGLGEHQGSPEGPQKYEGDGKAPAGIFEITQLWLRRGIAAPPQGGFKPQPIDEDTFGVDDPRSRFYNCIVQRSRVGVMDWQSAETMDIPEYDRVLVVAHNLEKPISGRGSCIFIHRWQSPTTPTSGCTALEARQLGQLVDWLKPASRPRLVQIPQNVAREWRNQGWIP